LTLRASEAAARLGVTVHQLRRWAERGILTPSARTPSGRQRRYEPRDLRRGLLLVSLLEEPGHRIPFKVAAARIERLHATVEGMLDQRGAEVLQVLTTTLSQPR
jgi:DNA-binding transcriptional MerR regulator